MASGLADRADIASRKENAKIFENRTLTCSSREDRKQWRLFLQTTL